MTTTRSDPGAAPRARSRPLAAYAVLARNAVSLYGTTVVTSLFGFAFWWLAARLLSAGEYGQAFALVSSVQLLAMFSVAGLTTLSLSELSRDSSRAQTLLATALGAATAIAMVTATGTALVLPLVAPAYQGPLGDPLRLLVFAAAVVVTTLTLILDDACIGLLRGQLQLRRNTAFAAVKLALLPVAALAVPAAAGSQVLAAWVLGAVVSLWFLRPLLRVGGGPRRVDLGLVRSRWREAMTHHWLNVSLEVPRLLLTVLALPLVGEEDTGALAVAVTVAAFAQVVPAHFATVLFAIAPGDVATLRQQSRFTMTVCVLVSLAAALVLVPLAPFVLALFNPHFVVAADALRILAVGTVLWTVKSHFIAACRVTGRFTRAAAFCTGGAFVEVAATVAGMVVWGVTGAAAGLVAAVALEGLVMAPTVVATLRRPSEQRGG